MGRPAFRVDGATGITCSRCLELHEPALLEARLMVCPSCGCHLRLGARDRLALLADDGSFLEWDAGLAAADPLRFSDRKAYPERVEEARCGTGERDAVVTGAGRLRHRPLALAAFEFGFMGGSMGAVVGERLSRLFDRARAHGMPAVVVTASGGARMQEGLQALMQMAKVTAAIERFREARLPYVSVLADPTTGGVAASVAALGDFVVAEPGAQIGFAGPRVIEQTIGAPLPADFQRAERLLERGLVDAVVPRAELRDWVDGVLAATVPSGRARS